MQRRPNIASAGWDFAFAVLALIAGWLGASLPYALGVFTAAVIAWAWMRRNSLAALPLAQRFVQGAIALVMIAVVLGLAYWIGLMLGGHT
jgi:hypothetical protein